MIKGLLARTIPRVLILLLLLTLALPILPARLVFADTWAYSKVLSFNMSGISENLTNPTVTVSLNSTNFDFSQVKNDLTDIIFRDSDNVTLLNFEPDKYNSWVAQQAIFYVKVPKINANSNYSDYIIMLWGNPAAVDTSNMTATWDSSYALVQHLSDNTTSSVLDSTSNNNYGGKPGANHPIQATGKIGYAQSFNGSGDYINDGSNASLSITGNLSISFWFNPGTNGSQAGYVYRAGSW